MMSFYRSTVFTNCVALCVRISRVSLDMLTDQRTSSSANKNYCFVLFCTCCCLNMAPPELAVLFFYFLFLGTPNQRSGMRLRGICSYTRLFKGQRHCDFFSMLLALSASNQTLPLPLESATLTMGETGPVLLDLFLCCVREVRTCAIHVFWAYLRMRLQPFF